MKKLAHILPALALAAVCSTAFAQAPAGAPAGATGVCKDGTYSTAASKSGACGGHKGVKTWFAPAAAKPAAATAAKPAVAVKPAPAAAAPAAKPMTMPMSTPAPAAKPAPAVSATPSTPAKPTAAAAPGGGPGMVWVNTSTKVYHCPGDRYYGKTKAGSYMTEAAAKAAGFKADANKPCK